MQNHLASLSLGFPVCKMGQQEHPPHQVRTKCIGPYIGSLHFNNNYDLLSSCSSIKQYDPTLRYPTPVVPWALYPIFVCDPVGWVSLFLF